MADKDNKFKVPSTWNMIKKVNKDKGDKLAENISVTGQRLSQAEPMTLDERAESSIRNGADPILNDPKEYAKNTLRETGKAGIDIAADIGLDMALAPVEAAITGSKIGKAVGKGLTKAGEAITKGVKKAGIAIAPKTSNKILKKAADIAANEKEWARIMKEADLMEEAFNNKDLMKQAKEQAEKEIKLLTDVANSYNDKTSFIEAASNDYKKKVKQPNGTLKEESIKTDFTPIDRKLKDQTPGLDRVLRESNSEETKEVLEEIQKSNKQLAEDFLKGKIGEKEYLEKSYENMIKEANLGTGASNKKYIESKGDAVALLRNNKNPMSNSKIDELYKEFIDNPLEYPYLKELLSKNKDTEIETIMKSLAIKDPVTFYHSVRTAELAENSLGFLQKLAKGSSEDKKLLLDILNGDKNLYNQVLKYDTKDFAKAMLLHDTGKLAVPTRALYTLTGYDNLINTHSEYGQEILSNMNDSLSNFYALIAGSHHPRATIKTTIGNKTVEKNLKSLISTPADDFINQLSNGSDVYEAITSVMRPYKTAKTKKEGAEFGYNRFKGLFEELEKSGNIPSRVMKNLEIEDAFNATRADSLIENIYNAYENNFMEEYAAKYGTEDMKKYAASNTKSLIFLLFGTAASKAQVQEFGKPKGVANQIFTSILSPSEVLVDKTHYDKIQEIKKAYKNGKLTDEQKEMLTKVDWNDPVSVSMMYNNIMSK